MSTIVILGRSPMVEDVKLMLNSSMLRYLNRNTDEPMYDEEYRGGCSYISCIGSPKSYTTKLDVLDKLDIKHWCSINANIPSVNHLGNGTLIFPSFISSTCRIHRHCLIMPGAVIHHGSILGPGSNIASNVVINGDVKLEGSCFIGAGSVIKEGVKIVSGVLIGANSYVNKDILYPGKYIGSPVRKMC